MEHHKIFGAFRGYQGPFVPDLYFDWIGGRYNCELFGATRPFVQTATWIPGLDEEYFEWIDVLEAAADARGKFTMLELGAGFGRWGVRGALAAKQRNIRDIDVRFVEAAPQHAALCRSILSINQLDDIHSCIIERAISYSGQPVIFAVTRADFAPEKWFGQSIVGGEAIETNRSFFGRKLYTDGTVGRIYVESVTFEELVKNIPLVDIVDADLQGSERELIPNAIATMNIKVRRAHIGTHAPDIEDEIREVFRKAGWRPVWDFPCGQEVETPYGRVLFQDGVQGWINPRL